MPCRQGQRVHRKNPLRSDILFAPIAEDPANVECAVRIQLVDEPHAAFAVRRAGSALLVQFNTVADGNVMARRLGRGVTVRRLGSGVVTRRLGGSGVGIDECRH